MVSFFNEPRPSNPLIRGRGPSKSAEEDRLRTASSCASVHPPPRFAASVFLVVLLLLSGCTSSTETSVGDGRGEQVGAQVETNLVEDPNCPGCPAGEAGKLIPRRHFHHYWGDLTEVVVFDSNVAFRPNVVHRAMDGQLPEGTPDDATNNVLEGCLSYGFREFDLEDGKSTPEGDVGGDQKSPINPDTGRADTVFAGTDYLTAELVDFSGAGLVGLKYKTAGNAEYLPRGCQHIPLVRGSPMKIPVGRGEADPPHQYFASKWRFRLYPLQLPPCGPLFGCVDQFPYLPMVAQGQAHVKITAHNGGNKSLDPAHPDLYAMSPVYHLGCSEEARADRMIMAPPAFPPRAALTEIKWKPGRIVPLQTGKVEVQLAVKYEGSVSGTTWELWYHGSNTTKYSKATLIAAEGDTQKYAIPDPDGILSDPPYEFESVWRFMAWPKGPGNGPTEFTGTVQLCAQAHRDPSAPPLT